MTTPRVRPGQVLHIQEPDYLYGVGGLTLRVAWTDPNPHPNLEWLRIVGTEVRWDGSDGATRDVLVPRALPSAPRSRPPC